MKRSCSILTTALMMAVGTCSATSAAAAPVTLIGADFDVRFDSALTGLFGTPVLNGNTITLNPLPAFKVESLAGNGEFIVDQTFSLQLLMHAGKAVTSIDLSEQGNYTLSGRQSDVAAWGELRADVGSLGTPELVQAITPVGYFRPNTDSVLSWSASSALDFSGFDATAQAQGLALDIQSALQAYTRPSDTGLRVASIDMTGGLVLSVAVVPEPESFMLALVGLGLLAGLARRAH